jgi:hypothetical protein
MAKRPVVCQRWLESERDWGCRPDGASLHLTVEDAKKYSKAYWDKMPKEVPHEYSREDGEPFLIDVDDESHRHRSKHSAGLKRARARYHEDIEIRSLA